MICSANQWTRFYIIGPPSWKSWSNSLLLITNIVIIVLIFYLHLISYSLSNITKTNAVSGWSTGQNSFQLKNNNIELPVNKQVSHETLQCEQESNQRYLEFLDPTNKDIGAESIIWDTLRDLVPSTKFNVKNTHRGVSLLAKLQLLASHIIWQSPKTKLV